MDNKYDICIGDNRWIRWIEFDGATVETTYINDLLEPTVELWENLEIVCLAECCGLGAFSFLPEDVDNAISDLDRNLLLLKLEKLKLEVSKIDNSVLISSRINQLIDKSVFINLVEYLIEEIGKASLFSF